MFIGHFSLAMATKRVQPNIPLPMLFLAAQLADLIWPTLLLLGIERAEVSHSEIPLSFTFYPYSHSLACLTLWGAILGVAWSAWSKSRAEGLMIFLLVVSHWFLDLLVHIPDLQFAPGMDLHVGLGLWRNRHVSLSLELLTLVAAIIVAKPFITSLVRWKRLTLYALLAVLVLIQLADTFSSPPTNIMAVAWSAQLIWVLILWAALVDWKTARATASGFIQ